MAQKTNKGSKTKKSEKPSCTAETDTPKAGGSSATSAPKSLQDILEETSPERVEALTKNLTEALFESQEILRSVTTKKLKSALDPETADPFGAGSAFMKVGENLARHPDKVIDAQMKLWEKHLEVWQEFVSGPSEETHRKDKRFSDPEWSDNPVFKVIRQSYELNSSFLLDLISASEDLDENTRRKATFFARQTADAFSPTNFFTTNPTALKAMLETGGESVVAGLKQAREDLQRGHGRLLISQTDGTQFEVGKNVATAPGKIIYRNELIEILQFEPTTEKVFKTPLLIFPPWINKYYILDLREENSMIRWLVSKGLTVFVVSWRSADRSMFKFTWDDYVQRGAFEAVKTVLNVTGEEHLNAVGYCIGGTMLASALSLMAQDDDDRVQSATFFASQSDFELAGDLKVFTDEGSIHHISAMIEKNGGIMSGDDMAETFNYLRPSDLVWRYVVDNYLLGKKPKPFDLLFWNSDQTNIPGPTHITYLSDLYGKNELAKGEFRVLGRTVNLSDISIPTLFQAGRDDHISPYQSVFRSAKAFGGDARFVLAGSGHIAGVINHPDAKKYQHWTNDNPLPDSVDEWVENSTEHPGSWWPYWFKWLKPLSGPKVPARAIHDQGLGDAPGTYVKRTLADLGVGASGGAGQ